MHFKAVVEAVTALQNRLIEEEDPKAGKSFYVWLDYVSIPQANKTLQSLSISSLALYASMPDYFLVVAPPATHVETRSACDTRTYLRRGWYARLMLGTKPPRFSVFHSCVTRCAPSPPSLRCRLEQWARITVGGTEGVALHNSSPHKPKP